LLLPLLWPSWGISWVLLSLGKLLLLLLLLLLPHTLPALPGSRPLGLLGSTGASSCRPRF
jgi:hypothetical protein